MSKETKDQIIEILKNLAEQLGKESLSKKEIAKVISLSKINYHFGNAGNALNAAGLIRKAQGENFMGRKKQLSHEQLFEALYSLEKKIGKEPGYNDNSANGEYSGKPYTQRFGKWPEVLSYYRKWKIENNKNISQINPVNLIKKNPSIIRKNKKSSIDLSKTIPQQFYGEPIDFRGLRHAPINEQGVVFLFAMISRELGFSIESIQQGFPDCEGKYEHDSKKNLWAKARIEFEYKSSNFEMHGHDPDQCDFIVCWQDDWPDCPVTVIELKTEILKLPSNFLPK
ncbi:MAG: hypothetical protein P9L94_07230 [Candidatus Hinthialibacter antarcticus]|nr:hypothetical protein [Candidatus Hinthialibacter antarcticus]